MNSFKQLTPLALNLLESLVIADEDADFAAISEWGNSQQSKKE